MRFNFEAHLIVDILMNFKIWSVKTCARNGRFISDAFLDPYHLLPAPPSSLLQLSREDNAAAGCWVSNNRSHVVPQLYKNAFMGVAILFGCLDPSSLGLEGCLRKQNRSPGKHYVMSLFKRFAMRLFCWDILKQNVLIPILNFTFDKHRKRQYCGA